MKMNIIAITKGVILPRFLLCLGLWALIKIGLDPAPVPSSSHPEVEYGAVIFLIGVLILASLGIPRVEQSGAILVAATGLLIIIINHLLNFIYGYDWFEGLWSFTPDFIRYGTYALIGYILASRRGVGWAVLIVGVIALLDSFLGWAALLPTQLSLIHWITPQGESIFTLWHYNWNDAPGIFIRLLWQGTIWGLFGFVGAMSTKLFGLTKGYYRNLTLGSSNR
jgi:hypothetical protein